MEIRTGAEKAPTEGERGGTRRTSVGIQIRGKKGRSEEEIYEVVLKIDAIMEEVEHDPKVAKQAEEDQRRYGTLTPEELRREFTI